MSTRKTTTVVVLLLVVAGAWYAFRPERLFIDRKVNEQFPTAAAAAAQSVKLASGNFHGVAHETKGVATIYQLPDGRKTVRLTEFQTSNGPDVQVYLVAAADANDNSAVTDAGFVSLGGMKGNVGDQNYDLPADVDLNKYRAVTIWCRRFGVNFATAPLRGQS
ncbi:MAG TPA: DM13 domain-containing protein [Pyrinomonadaceae bacterium]|jgi:hypothetical protein|nr:DM13 domain-containing protein [Pyrinomonadaceae bacterium]